MIVFLILWNLGISVLNCWFVGKSWAESKAIGGWFRFITWCAAVMGTCGFIWINIIVLGFVASTHVALLPLKYQLTDPWLELLYDIGYLIVIFPILGSGMGIWLDSVKEAYKRRDGISIGVAGYNTFAQGYNTYEAAKFIPTILKKIGKQINDADTAQSKGMWLVIDTVLILSVGLGVATAWYIIHTTAEGVAQKAHVAALEAQVAAKGKARA
jgi:hypothetical protein